MLETFSTRQILEVWKDSVVESVRRDIPDLSSRQMAVMLTVYMGEGPHTVRGLAQALNVSKPAITRALDTLGRLGLIKRRRDEEDRRSVLVVRTVKGSVFLSEFSTMVLQAAKTVAARGDSPPENAPVAGQHDSPLPQPAVANAATA